MGRNVQVRASYQNDAGYLTRLVKAIEIDPNRSVPWKKKVIAALNIVIVNFLQATEQDLSKGEKTAAGGNRKGAKT